MALKLQGLLDCGIRCVINLMEPDERDHDGLPFLDYAPGADTDGHRLCCQAVSFSKSVTCISMTETTSNIKVIH